jgi:hypothetical protein
MWFDRPAEASRFGVAYAINLRITLPVSKSKGVAQFPTENQLRQTIQDAVIAEALILTAETDDRISGFAQEHENVFAQVRVYDSLASSTGRSEYVTYYAGPEGDFRTSRIDFEVDVLNESGLRSGRTDNYAVGPDFNSEAFPEHRAYVALKDRVLSAVSSETGCRPEESVLNVFVHETDEGVRHWTVDQDIRGCPGPLNLLLRIRVGQDGELLATGIRDLTEEEYARLGLSREDVETWKREAYAGMAFPVPTGTEFSVAQQVEVPEIPFQKRLGTYVVRVPQYAWLVIAAAFILVMLTAWRRFRRGRAAPSK